MVYISEPSVANELSLNTLRTQRKDSILRKKMKRTYKIMHAIDGM